MTVQDLWTGKPLEGREGTYSVQLPAHGSGLYQIAGRFQLMPPPTPQPTPKPEGIVYEAEDALLSGGALLAMDHEGYSGKGFVAGYYQGTGQKTAFRVKSAEEGKRRAVFRFGNAMGSEQTLGLYVNGQFIQKVKFKDLGDWDNWDDSTVDLVLKKGTNQVALQKDRDDGCINLDYLAVR